MGERCEEELKETDFLGGLDLVVHGGGHGGCLRFLGVLGRR